MTAIDTGVCAPECVATLLIQQRQLVEGRRVAQMFPLGTCELPLPHDCERMENARGVFHFRPEKITAQGIRSMSANGCENLFLNLGPFSKSEIAVRAMAGETVTCITEFAPGGVEVRCAAGTDGTAAEQLAYFESTKEPDSIVVVGQLPARVASALRG